nr:MAG: hypothetical protein [Bacteriophage sp.]
MKIESNIGTLTYGEFVDGYLSMYLVVDDIPDGLQEKLNKELKKAAKIEYENNWDVYIKHGILKYEDIKLEVIRKLVLIIISQNAIEYKLAVDAEDTVSGAFEAFADIPLDSDFISIKSVQKIIEEKILPS